MGALRDRKDGGGFKTGENNTLDDREVKNAGEDRYLPWDVIWAGCFSGANFA